MRAVVLREIGQLELAKVPVPQPKEGQALVKVISTAVCRSDVSGFLGKHPMIEPPRIMGHECSGVVEEVGPGVANWERGDEVVVETFFYTCGRCPGCRAGRYNVCNDVKVIGHNVDGAFAEYVLANASFLHPKPPTVSFDEAALTEPLSVGVHAVRRCAVTIGDFVVIIGAGVIGLMVLQVAKAAGAEVLIADLSERKLELARKLGADHIVDASSEDLKEAVSSATDGEMAPVVFEAVGKPETLKQMVEVACSGARVMPIGFTGKPTDEINLSRVTLAEIDVLGILGFWHDFPISLSLMRRGLVDLRSMITQTFPLADVEKAIRLAIERPDEVLRAVIHPQE